MAKLLLNFRGVPDDEIEEVREVLQSGGIDIYETEPNPWAISAGGIWLADDSQYQAAKDLLDAYQEQRRTAARAEYQQKTQDGSCETIFDKIMAEPLRFIFYLAAVLAILYFSTKPFLDLGK